MGVKDWSSYIRVSTDSFALTFLFWHIIELVWNCGLLIPLYHCRSRESQMIHIAFLLFLLWHCSNSYQLHIPKHLLGVFLFPLCCRIFFIHSLHQVVQMNAYMVSCVSPSACLYVTTHKPNSWFLNLIPTSLMQKLVKGGGGTQFRTWFWKYVW